MNTSKLMKLLPNWITWVLVAVIGVMLASLFWLVLTPPEPLPTAAVSSKGQVKVATQAVNYGPVVAKQHMFGWIPPKPKAAPPKPKAEAPPPKPKPVVTKLTLKLHGILAREGQTSFAIISSAKKKKQAIYGVGDEPQKGVKIESILPKKILLRHSGKLEELLLPEKKLPKVAVQAKPIKSEPVDGNRWNLGSKRRRPAPPAIDPLPVEAPSIDDSLPADDMAALRDAITVNPDKLLEIASISEAKDKEGNLTGFRLSPGKNRKLFRSLGLRPGDIVTKVNGIELTDPSKGLMVMSELSSATSIAITVKRGDQEVTIEKQF